MRIKRSLFVISLLVLFLFCYTIMNKHFDELARYPYELSESQRKLVLEHLNTDEINTLISNKIEPKQFLPYIEEEGFELSNTLWYDSFYLTQSEKQSKNFIISFVNKYKSHLQYNEIKDLVSNYSFNVMIRFFDEGDAYVSGTKLVANPDYKYTMLTSKQTIHSYEPKDLVSVGSLPHTSIVKDANDILVKSEVLAPLQQLCDAAKEINGKAYGDMQLVAGYISYEDQIKLYENAIKKHNGKDLKEFWDYPGQSEYQLGYSVQLLPNEVQADITNREMETNAENKVSISEGEREQEIWLKDNAYKYGFVIRYTKANEEVTGKKHQPYTLRYVGKEMAKQMHDKNLPLEDVTLSEYK
ncbi:MAG: M15 family metallopeptidase [Longicatena sp.]